ncbi:unnamed protein product [Effrenium voratum]|nr:unnamed protein product [Effrenium voratum]
MLGAESPWLDAALVVVVRPFLTDETGPRELVQPLDPDVCERNRTLYGHKAVVECLLEAGANKDNGDRDGRTPMQLAAMNGNEGVVHCLLRAGADKNKADHEGRTPCTLLQAWAKGCADKNKPNTDGRTPMRLAAGNGPHHACMMWRFACLKLALTRTGQLLTEIRLCITPMNGHSKSFALLAASWC